MFLGKPLLASLVFLAGAITCSYAMDTAPLFNIQQLAPDYEIVEGAAFYTIHGFRTWAGTQLISDGSNPIIMEGKICVCSGRGGIMSKVCNTHYCPSRNLINHKIDALIVTYHDEDWDPIAWVDITNLKLQCCATEDGKQVSAEYDEASYKKLRKNELDTAHKYCRSHLDPSIKPKAKSVSIKHSWNHMPPAEWADELDTYIITFYGQAGYEIAQFDSEHKPNFCGSFQYDFEEYIDVTDLDNEKTYDVTCCTLF